MSGRRVSLNVAVAVLAFTAAPANAQAYRGAVTALTGSAAYSNLAAGSGANVLLSSGWFGMLQAEAWAGRVGLRLNGGLSNPPLVDDSLMSFRLMTGDVDLMLRLRRPYSNLFFQPYAVLGLGTVHYDLRPDTTFVDGQAYGPGATARTSVAAGLGTDLGSGPVALRFEMLDIIGLRSPLNRTTGTAYGPVQHFVVTLGLSLRFGRIAGLAARPRRTTTAVAVRPTSPSPASPPAMPRPRPEPRRPEPHPRPPARSTPEQPAPARPAPTPSQPAPAPAQPEPTPAQPPVALPPKTEPEPVPARPTPMPRPEEPGPGNPRPTPPPVSPAPTPPDTTPAPTPPDTTPAPTPPDTTPAPTPADTAPAAGGTVHGRLFTVLVTWDRASQSDAQQAGALDAAMSGAGIPVWPMPDSVVDGRSLARARVGAVRNDEDGKTLGAYVEATYGFPFHVIHIEKSQEVPAAEVQASEAFVDGLDKAKGKKGGKQPD